MTNKELSAALGVVVAIVAGTVSGINWLNDYVERGDIADRIFYLEREVEQLTKVKTLYDVREQEAGELSPSDRGRRNQVINDLADVRREISNLEAARRGL